MYVYNAEHRLLRLGREAAWKFLRDVSRQSFDAWRVGRKNLAPKTLNDYLALVGVMWRWLGDAVGDFPLASSRRVSTKGQDSKRRAYSDLDLDALFKHAGDYRLAILFATVSGCRRAELEKLCWGDLDLDAVEPSVTLRAVTTKNGKRAVFPLYGNVACELIAVRTCQDGLVFPKGLPSMKELRVMLKVAGITEVDGLGRRLVVHSTRYTFCTLLHRWRWPEARVMQGMRVVDRKLIDRTYLDPRMLSQTLPDGVVPWSPRSLPRSLFLQCDTVQNPNDGDLIMKDGIDEKARKQALFRELAAVLGVAPELAENWGSRIRT